MEKFDKFWNWLDGKKMAIGAILGNFLALSVATDLKINPELFKLLTIISGMITGVGAFHKGYKVVYKNKDTNKIEEVKTEETKIE